MFKRVKGRRTGIGTGRMPWGRGVRRSRRERGTGLVWSTPERQFGMQVPGSPDPNLVRPSRSKERG